MRRICFIAKTNINTDGRILNELKILHDNFNDLDIHFVLLPDSKVNLEYKSLFKLHSINCLVRNSSIFRPLTVIEFTIKSFFKLKEIRPDIIHVQDGDVALPVLLYKIFFKKGYKVLYDDHEFPNENSDFFSKVINCFENSLIKKADAVLFTNEERLELIKNQHQPRGILEYLLNLPYNQDNSTSLELGMTHPGIEQMKAETNNNTSFIIHQGPINTERGEEKLAKFAYILPQKYKIMLIGGNEKAYQSFLKKYKLDKNRFFYVGTVDYWDLPNFWELGSASIVMYLPTFTNNRLCAPNRLYLAYQYGLPIIVNKDNPVLHNFITKNKCGYFIEDFNEKNIKMLKDFKKYSSDGFNDLKKNEEEKFVRLYHFLLKD